MGELLESQVYDADGRRLGKVHDLRLVQDGPDRGPLGPMLRVDGLIVGDGALAIRLGYHRAGVRGPFLLGRLFRWLEGRARYVPWDRIASHTDERVDLDCSRDDLPRIPDIG